LGQEFVIKSPAIEDKINQLLPSQGGYAPGVDFSASTTVIPIVDLTETAEGSQVRQDLQTAFSFNNSTPHSVTNTTTTIINTTGYYKVYGYASLKTSTSASTTVSFIVNDGTTDKDLFAVFAGATTDVLATNNMYDFVIKLEAGDSLKINASNGCLALGTSRQIADIQGNLT